MTLVAKPLGRGYAAVAVWSQGRQQTLEAGAIAEHKEETSVVYSAEGLPKPHSGALQVLGERKQDYRAPPPAAGSPLFAASGKRLPYSEILCSKPV